MCIRDSLHPTLEAVGHVGRVPVEFVARLQQAGAERKGPDEPLAGGDDLQRPIALFEELHRVGDGPGFAEEGASLGQLADDERLSLLHRLAGQLAVGGLRRLGID